MSIFAALLPRDQNNQENQNKSDDDGGFFFCFHAGKYFDVQYQDVKNRLQSALILKPPFHQIIADKPDLYGPFWIATTLIVIIIASSSLLSFFQSSSTVPSTYNFDYIPVASSLIFGITFGSPYLIAILAKCFGGKMPVVRLICIYGYSMTAFIPATFFCFIQSNILQIIILTISFGISVCFLVKNVMNIQTQLQEKQKYLINSLLVGAQFILVLTYKFYFFKFK